MQDNFDIPNLLQKETMKIKLNKNIFVSIGIGLVILIVLGFFTFYYIAPFGAQVVYNFTSSDKDKISNLNGAQPSESINNNATGTLTIPEQTIRQNIVTFNLKLLSNNIQGVWVNLKFKGDPNELKIGVKGSIDDPYLYKSLYNKILEDLKDLRIDNGLAFWQKENNFKTFADFAKKPPTDKLIATYFFEPFEIYAYQPVNSATGEFSSNKSLRGTHELLIKVDKSPLNINIEKQDQNMYKGPDVLSIQVYKDDKLLVTKEVPDDGIVDATNLMLQPQEAKLELNDIEPGVYRLLLLDESTHSDVRISSIKINQKNVIFNSPVFIVNSKPTKLFTNSLQINALTYHSEGLQTLKINGTKDFEIAKIGVNYQINLGENTNQNQITTASKLNEIDIPQNDLSIKGDGVFTFDKNSFFNPNPLNSVDLTSVTDTSSLDYIIADYQKAKKDGDWNIAQVYIDPKDINIDGDKLYFSLESPGLSQSGGEIAIGSLEVTVNKPGWFNSSSNNSINNLSPIVATATKESEGFFGDIWNSTTTFFGGIWNGTANFFTGLWPFGPLPPSGSGERKGQQQEITPTPTLGPTNTPTPTPTLKEKLKITVQNGGGIVGIAAKYADLFKKAGFKNVETGDSPSAYENATISVNQGEEAELEPTVTEIEAIMNQDYAIVNRITTADRGNINIILGEISKPTPTGSPIPTIKPK